MSQLRGDLGVPVQPLQMYHIVGSEWVKSPLRFKIEPERGDTIEEANETDGRKLSDLMYPLENLRKKGSEE